MDLSHSENIILRHILENSNYFDNCRREYFKNESLGSIFEAAKSFWDKYHEMPTSAQMIEYFKVMKDNSVDPAEINGIYDIELKKYEDTWLVDTTQFFIEYKTLTKSAVDGLKYIQSTPASSENIRTIIDTFKGIITERNNIDFSFDEGLDFFNPESHKQYTQNTFSSGYPFIDTVLGGGFSAKALYVFMGMPKVGKSLCLGNIAAQAVRSGHNVAVLSLEMADRKYVKRMGANILGVPIKEYNNIAENEEVLKRKISSITYDNLKIKK